MVLRELTKLTNVYKDQEIYICTSIIHTISTSHEPEAHSNFSQDLVKGLWILCTCYWAFIYLSHTVINHTKNQMLIYVLYQYTFDLIVRSNICYWDYYFLDHILIRKCIGL